MTEPTEERGPRDPAAVLRTAVAIYAAIVLSSGAAILLAPGIFWGSIGGASGPERATFEGLRWVGGALAALGVGSLMVLLRPQGQRTFVTVMSLHLSLAAAATAYSWIADEIPLRAWFIATGLVVSVLGAAYLWWARLRARKILA